jgi:hypothetical protein
MFWSNNNLSVIVEKIGIGLPTGTPILHLCLQLMKFSFKNFNQDQIKEYEQTVVVTVNNSKIINVYRMA